jgi:hypothetical protein
MAYLSHFSSEQQSYAEHLIPFLIPKVKVVIINILDAAVKFGSIIWVFEASGDHGYFTGITILSQSFNTAECSRSIYMKPDLLPTITTLRRSVWSRGSQGGIIFFGM